MCLDASYDSEPVREELKERGYCLTSVRPTRRRGSEKEPCIVTVGGPGVG